MRTNALRISAAGVAAALVLAGCGGESGGEATAESTGTNNGSTSSTSESPASSSNGGGSVDQQSVAWMNKFCSQVLKFVNIGQIEQPNVQQGDVAGAHSALSDYIEKVVGRVSSMLDGLNGLPDAPAPQGDKAVQNFIDVFEPVKNDLQSVKSELDAADPTDQQAVLKAVEGVKSFGQSMQNVSNPLKVLEGSGLNEAGKQAENCQKLNS